MLGSRSGWNTCNRGCRASLGGLHGLTAKDSTTSERHYTGDEQFTGYANKGVGKTWIGDVSPHVEGLDAGQELRPREKPRAFRQG
jgi:hypothetical protein